MAAPVLSARRFQPARLLASLGGPWLALFLCLLTTPLGAQDRSQSADARSLFRQANEQYQKQNYPEARNLYLQIVQQGIRSPEVYYNLANTAARLGRVGEAVLYYEKARDLAPRDLDIQANLQRVAPPGNDPKPFVLAVPFHWLLHHYSVSEWMGSFLFLFLLSGVFGAVILARKLPAGLNPPARAVFAVAALVTVIIGLFAGIRFYQARQPRVVTMQPEVVVHSGPSDNYSQIAAVPEGTKLRRLEFSDDPQWARVELPSGQIGYTLSRNLEPI